MQKKNEFIVISLDVTMVIQKIIPHGTAGTSTYCRTDTTNCYARPVYLICEQLYVSHFVYIIFVLYRCKRELFVFFLYFQ